MLPSQHGVTARRIVGIVLVGLALIQEPVHAQASCRPNIFGGQDCTGPNGRLSSSRPSIFGGFDTSQPEGARSSSRPNIFGGQDCRFVMNGPLITSLLFLPYDRWEGYAAERQEIIDFIKMNNIKNVIFLSTDIHALIVNDQVGNATPPIIREFVSGAIGMDSIYRELPPSIVGFVPTLPSLFTTVSYFDIDRFNYGLIEVSPTQATVTYRDATGAALKSFTVTAAS